MGSWTHLQIGQLWIITAIGSTRVVITAVVIGRGGHVLCGKKRLASVQAARAGHVHRGHRQIYAPGNGKHPKSVRNTYHHINNCFNVNTI